MVLWKTWWAGIYRVEYCLGGNYIRRNFLDCNNPGGSFSGGNFLGGSYPGWEFSRLELSWVGIFQVGIFQVGVILGENFPGGSFPGWEFSLVGVLRVGIVQGNHPGGNFPGGSFPRTILKACKFLFDYNLKKFRSRLFILHCPFHKAKKLTLGMF